MRRAHFLKALSSNQIPSDCVWTDTETDAEIIDNKTERHVLREGISAYRRQYARGQWSKPKWTDYTTIKGFWDNIESRLHGKIKLYVFAHNWGFDAPVLDLFNELPKRGWTLQSAVIESPPIILTYRRDKHTLCFIDTLNIWRMPLSVLGDSLDLPKLEMPTDTSSKEAWHTYNKRDVEIIMTACINWFKFIRDYGLGGFAPTIASQAFRTFRHRFLHTEILIDDNDDALKLARSGVFGGRTECFEIGKLSGDVYKVDYNSMYPSVMHDNLYPTVLCGYGDSVSLKKLAEHLGSYCVVARVTVVTVEPIYPKHYNSRLIFPVGEFETTLSSPELIYGLAQGHIKKVHEIAIYFRANIFAGYIGFFHQLKQKAEAAGDMVLRGQCKLLLNSLWGKFAQQGRFYTKIGPDPENRIKVWADYDVDDDKLHHFRAFGGILEMKTDDPESRYSHPAISAHVTAHARLKLYTAIKKAGVDNVYYCDTDSIWCNRTGYDALADEIHPTKLGQLALEGESDNVTIFGLKDYEFGDETRIKGVKKRARKIATNIYEQEQFSSLKYNVRNGDLSAPIIRRVTKELQRVYTKATVLPTGRITPYLFVDGKRDDG